jgi:hypothetical protein
MEKDTSRADKESSHSSVNEKGSVGLADIVSHLASCQPPLK